MKKRNQKQKQNRLSVFSVLLAAVLLLGGTAAVGVGAVHLLSLEQAKLSDRPARQEQETRPAVTVAPEETAAEPSTESTAELVKPEKHPQSTDVQSRTTYTVSAVYAGDTAAQFPASLDGTKLTNAALQIYYRAALDACMNGSGKKPDPSRPLEEQPCPLGPGDLNWQQYLLQEAVNDWLLVQAMLDAAQQPQPITEEAYVPNLWQDLHTPNITPDLPVNDFLYIDQPCYKPNSMHQAYLDSLDLTLAEKAAALGYASLDDCCTALYGDAVTAADLLAAAREYNLAYMYFTERSFYTEITAEAVQSFIREHSAELPPEADYTLDVRHLLLVPEGASVDAQGRVTAEESVWASGKRAVEALQQKWLQEYPSSMIPNGKDINLSRWAFRESADDGSQINGGLYSNIRKGQLIQELDTWCFSPERKAGDYTILRSPLGYHIVMISRIHNAREAAVRQILRRQAEEAEWDSFLEGKTGRVNFGAAYLWTDCSAPGISLPDTLYPDIAHERYPEAMVYLQQDYANVPYGYSTVGKGGCGVTTMAMLATYMTDKMYTPAMLAKDYGRYYQTGGTAAEMFRYVPAELGFQLEDTVFDIDLVAQALLENKRVVSLQQLGHFTSGGHYLLLQDYYPETDTYQVRDSNIANYGRLQGHKVDYFTRDNILSGGSFFLIFPEKVTHSPACTRCGDGETRLIIHDYLCPRCTEAMERRGNFLNILAE